MVPNFTRFIPLISKKYALFRLSGGIFSGVLILSMLPMANIHNVGQLLILIISAAGGVAAVWFAVKEYLNPGDKIPLSFDMRLVFAGLLMLTLGYLVFRVDAGFQPAHALYAGAFFCIFKGVMFAENVMCPGFLFEEGQNYFREKVFGKMKPLPENFIASLVISDHSISFLDGNLKEFTLFVGQVKNFNSLANELRSMQRELIN
jgi:hypothetical protein